MYVITVLATKTHICPTCYHSTIKRSRCITTDSRGIQYRYKTKALATKDLKWWSPEHQARIEKLK
jgi:hypothetical protein